VPAPPAYKEVPADWKTAQPSDQIAKGKWWEIFQDAQLNALEEQVNVSNENLKAAEAQFQQARALVRYNRAAYYPTVTAGASAGREHLSSHRPLVPSSTSVNGTDLVIPVDVSYEPDVFGRIRHTVEAARANAQASAGDLESVRLSLHAELALDYFEMRTLDAEEQLLKSNVTSFERALELTQNRYKGGVASAVDVAQAQTQLENTRTQAIDVLILRAQNEHAIATLIGQPAPTFSVAASAWNSPPPDIPPGLPSELLERRPDIAAAERRVAAANAQVGVARAAYFPIFTLTGTGGFESTAITTLIQGPSGFLTAGAAAAVTAFDGGRRRAVSDEARAAYDQSVANYRQSVLTAFQEVEDNLAVLRESAAGRGGCRRTLAGAFHQPLQRRRSQLSGSDHSAEHGPGRRARCGGYSAPANGRQRLPDQSPGRRMEFRQPALRKDRSACADPDRPVRRPPVSHLRLVLR
jgi:NodT family efflux transporter outer membrane factor (OMF) lipoprotein